MDIHSLKIGDKLKCFSNYKNDWGTCDPIIGNLRVTHEYTLAGFEIRGFHTKLWFEEKPGLIFNSVHFEKEDNQSGG